MKAADPIRLIRACTEDTSILTSLISWLEAERETARKALETAEGNEIYKLQGKAECLRKLVSDIGAKTRMKGDVDDQSRVRSIR